MYRFGLPTMPAELSLYALSFLDRILLVRLAGLAEAGLYAIAVKFAQGISVLTRGFQLAWPPLAYSIADDEEARIFYARVVSWFLALCAFAVVGLWLLAPWVARLLTAPEFFDSHEAVGLVATGVTLYALYMVLIVVLGRTGRTELGFPATAAGAGANIALNLILIPPYGIIGAGVALVGSYVVVIAVMLAFTQRVFHVPYEWARIAQAILIAGALIAVGEIWVGITGAGAFTARLAISLAYPAVLWVTRFPSPEERREIRVRLAPDRLGATLRSLGRAEPSVAAAGPEEERRPRLAAEVIEAETRDEDSAY
jgi:O-antigen/teichoic acid export membrane protein